MMRYEDVYQKQDYQTRTERSQVSMVKTKTPDKVSQMLPIVQRVQSEPFGFSKKCL
jgi:hypothetical protein